MQEIVFTDLDGTLLDKETYSFEDATPALKLLKKEEIPLVICTSKTRKEIEYYRKKLGNKHPFISENGGGVFIPKGYFDFEFDYDKESKKYFIVELGTSYENLLRIVREIKGAEIKIRNFNSMSLEEISKDSGLSLEKAKLAKNREYDEPFEIPNKKDKKKIMKIIEKNNLNCLKGGRYYHLMGDNDKGKAVKILKKLFERKFKKMRTYGFGDSKNDFDMLDVVDEPYLVQKKSGEYASERYKKIKGIGPKGWNKKILEIIKKE